MATIRIDSNIIEEHLADEAEVVVTSFSWTSGGVRDSNVEIDYDINVDNDLEYEDEDYVYAEDHDLVVQERDQLARDLDEMTDKYHKAVFDYEALVKTIDKPVQPKKSFKFFSIFGK